MQLNVKKKKKKSKPKMGRVSKHTFLQRRYIDNLKAYEKVLNISNY